MQTTLALEDVRGIVRLLGDIAEISGDLPSKRRALMTELTSLIDARMWLWLHIRDDEAAGNAPMAFLHQDGGWESESQRLQFCEASFSPVIHEFNARLREELDGHHTRRREDMFSDDRWFSSDLVRDYFHPAHIGEFIWSVRPIGGNQYSSMWFLRPLGRPAFTAREICIVHLIAEQVSWLHHDGIDVPAADHVNELSSRQKQILLQVMAGDSVKEIARKVALSPHTVNDHMKHIYRRFGVVARGELLAQFLSGGK